ncbi:hypothetical protein RJT34_31824 [Clitoria ternatea]|uniref:Small auxin-up RNA n=1 Tax=Clitoria ternatea TaxID=43366 RepID=A0AAN9I3X8_CLITE
MGFRLPGLQRRSDIPKGYLAVYVGENKKKLFVIPISYLNQPSFQDLLSKVEQEFGFDHPMGGLTIPCREDVFLDITSHLHNIFYYYGEIRAKLSFDNPCIVAREATSSDYRIGRNSKLTYDNDPVILKAGTK